MLNRMTPASLHTALSQQTSFRFKLLLNCLLGALVLWDVLSTSGETTNRSLDCLTDCILTSPADPADPVLYPNDASVEWYITAPTNRRIIVIFNYFNLEYLGDYLIVQDRVNYFNKKTYTGENVKFPPYMTVGHSLHITFTSSDRGRREGFNISVSCNEPSKASSGQLVGGSSPAEGFLQLPSPSGEWRLVCEDNLQARVAEVVCGELGFPGVTDISHENDTCLSDDNCTRAPACQENTYRLQDCIPIHSTCSSDKAVKVKCVEPGYIGCYNFDMKQPQNGSSFESTAQCISSCRTKYLHDETKEVQAIAIMSHLECFCTTTSEISLEDTTRLPNYECAQRTENESTPTASKSKMLVYSASIGFCDELNDVEGGSWDSNITWFGSLVHLTCTDGYSLNGSGTLQCVPGSTPYYPIWNDSSPSCIINVDPPNIVTVPVIIGTVLGIAVILFILILYIYKHGGRCKSWKGRFQQRQRQTQHETRSIDTNSPERAVITDFRNSPKGPSREIAGRRFNGRPRIRTNDSITPLAVRAPALPHNVHDVPHDSRPATRTTTSRPLRLLHQNNPRNENHYISSNSAPTPHYYTSRSDNPSEASADIEAYQDPSTVDIANRAYEGTTDDQGVSNPTLGNLSPYYYVCSSNTPREASTYASSLEEAYQEHSNTDIARHAYEGTTEQEQSSATLANRLGLSMISRPLPHRPSSSNYNEGPTLPPRKTPRGSKKESPASASLRKQQRRSWSMFTGLQSYTRLTKEARDFEKSDGTTSNPLLQYSRERRETKKRS